LSTIAAICALQMGQSNSNQKKQNQEDKRLAVRRYNDAALALNLLYEATLKHASALEIFRNAAQKFL
jgi:hypothetical protein